MRIPRLDFELTTACDHRCMHCYNVWGDPQAGYARGALPTAAYLAMLERAIRQTGVESVNFTGGEPLLHRDALAILERARQLVDDVRLITNGGHVTPEVARALGAMGVSSVQLTLLSAEPARHDELKGIACFDDTVQAVLDLREAGVAVQGCFVATARNCDDFEEVLGLWHLLGVRSLSYNRMAPTGGAVQRLGDLLPTVAQVRSNLDTAERLGPEYGLAVGTAMPIPPCLVPLESYRWVTFGFCSTGSSSPNLVVDPLGAVRSCNLAGSVLGNLALEDWPVVWARVRQYQARFRRALPAACRGCGWATTCQGGCKESALATFGSLEHPEPFLDLALGRSTSPGGSALPSAGRPAPSGASARPDFLTVCWRPHVERWYRLLSRLDLGMDAANLYRKGEPPPARQGDEPDDATRELLRAYDAAPGRLAAQVLPLWFEDETGLLRFLADPAGGLDEAAGRRLCRLLAGAYLAEPVPTAEAADQGALEGKLLRLLEVLHGGPPPPLRVYSVPSLAAGTFTHGRATRVGSEGRVAVSFRCPPEQTLLQVLHEVVHSVSDPEVLERLGGGSPDTRAGSPGFEVHSSVERAVVDRTRALLEAECPALLPGFEAWCQRFGAAPA